jgi:hypothetical protein
LDSGDVLQPDAFDGLLDRDEQWIAGAAVIVDNRDEPLSKIISETPASQASHLMRDSGIIAPGGSLWRRSLLTDHGVLDTGLAHAAEYEWHCRLLSLGILPTVVNRTIVSLRETQAASAQATLQFGEELIHVAERICSRSVAGRSDDGQAEPG